MPLYNYTLRRGSQSPVIQYKTVRGYIFPKWGNTPEEVTLRVKKTKSKQAFPDADFKGLFVRRGLFPLVHSMIISIGKTRYLVGGYLGPNSAENRSLSLVARQISWRGEIAIFGLGTRVQFLASPAGTMDIINAAVTVFMTRVLEATTVGITLPKEVHVAEVPGFFLEQGRRSRNHAQTSTDLRLEAPVA